MAEKKSVVVPRKSFVSRVVSKVMDEAKEKVDEVFHVEPKRAATCPVDGSSKPAQGPCPVCGTL